jgi:hypothetical protein
VLPSAIIYQYVKCVYYMANNYREREGGLHRIFTPTERGGGRCMSNFNTHTHSERGRWRTLYVIFQHPRTHTHTHTQMGMGLYDCIHRIFRETETNVTVLSYCERERL